MKKLLGALVMAGICQTAFAAGITVEKPWARATVEGMHMGGAFMNIKNDTRRDDFLIGGSSPVSDKIEVHTHVNDNGVMRMREVEGGIPLKAGQTTELKPGSYHIMFMGLKRPLKQGEKVPVTLKFKRAKPQTINVDVNTAPKDSGNGHNQGGHSAH
ncbi:copper chaperone PCu(A)C [Neisseria sp.]|uniref:copper chaperone PCu(A)C n=1 Tax=Neisseria sp. TaxID=192066 RepID=UPI0026DBC79D|nr:copper chaperone PCu(A)C [Neisseria sp.]MDO4906558.1 copper chaperone PCu(A)C [Neisseria sp.]